jgi:hypothetical protein
MNQWLFDFVGGLHLGVKFWKVGVTGFDWETELLGACRGAIARQTWQRFNCRQSVSSGRLSG